MLVDVGEELRSHTTLSQRLHRASRAESARVGHADDGDGDDGVEDRRQSDDTSIRNGQDERRVSGVGRRRQGETRILRRQDKAQDEEIDDIEEKDSEKDLLSGEGDGFSRIL